MKASGQAALLNQAYIATFAGNGQFAVGDGGSAANGGLSNPNQGAFDSAGNFYVADTGHNRIRRIDAGTGLVSTVAGTGEAGYGGDGGPATSAVLDQPQSVAIDAQGNLYISDFGNHRVREVIAATGTIQTVAGNGSWGEGPMGYPATQTVVDGAYAVAFDAAGNFYIDDAGQNCIFKVTVSTGILTLFAGTQSLTGSFSGDGGPATEATFNQPFGMAFDGDGNLVVADTGNNRIRSVDATTGVITTIAGNGTAGFSGDGGAAADAEFNTVLWIEFDGAGNMYLADAANHRVRAIAKATGMVSTIAGDGAAGFSGDGGLATAAELSYPSGLALDAAGALFVADNHNGRIRKVSADSLAATTINLSTSRAILPAGMPVTLTAQVTAATGATPQGTVAFFSDATEVGTQALDGTGTAAIALTPTAGTHVMTAIYEGSATDRPAVSAGTPVAVYGITTTTTLSASAATLPYGQTLTLTSRVTAASGAVPTGSVVFSNGTAVLGSGVLDGAGQATLAMLPTIGAYSITASYAGNGTDLVSVSPAVNVTVTNGTTSALEIYTFAGNGTAGYSGDGGPAVEAEIDLP